MKKRLTEALTAGVRAMHAGDERGMARARAALAGHRESLCEFAIRVLFDDEP